MNRLGLLPLSALILASCATSEPDNRVLVSVGPSNYSAEQVHAICRSEALNTRAAVNASRPTQITINSQPSPGGFGAGFAEAYARSAEARRYSGEEESAAAYEGCAARLGYVLR